MTKINDDILAKLIDVSISKYDEFELESVKLRKDMDDYVMIQNDKFKQLEGDNHEYYDKYVLNRINKQDITFQKEKTIKVNKEDLENMVSYTESLEEELKQIKRLIKQDYGVEL